MPFLLVTMLCVVTPLFAPHLQTTHLPTGSSLTTANCLLPTEMPFLLVTTLSMVTPLFAPHLQTTHLPTLFTVNCQLLTAN
jgi:hypothetical protein